MPSSSSVPGAQELAVVERGGFTESRHFGSAVVVAADGEIVREVGDPSAPILPRSALKPVQALASLAAGAVLADAQIGLATASHSGTERHIAVVRGILHGVGLGEDHLGCPAAWPIERTARDDMVRDLATAAPVRMECSGTHAAMLAACVANDWPVADYLAPLHPLQVHVREILERLTGERVAGTVVDGCGAPAHAVTLAGLTRATQRIGTSSERSPFALHRHAGSILRAVREHPWTIAGDGRPDTVAISRLNVFAKSGAEGVITAVAPDGTAVSVKVIDGSSRPALAVALRLLRDAGAVDEADATDALSALTSSTAGSGRAGTVRVTL